MNNVIIRTAKQDYVCCGCEHIIRKGTEYLDRVVLNNGKCVQHERYHDICPKEHVLITLLNKTVANDGQYPVCSDGIKYWFVGVMYNDTDLVAVVQSWDKLGTLYIDEATFRKEWQYE